MMADVSWCRSRTGIGYLQEFCFQSLMESSRGECERKIGAVHKVRHAIFGQFLPLPCHTSSHIPGPPRFLEGLVQKTRTKAPLYKFCFNCSRGFCPGVLSGVFCVEGFVGGCFCPFSVCQNTSVTSES